MRSRPVHMNRLISFVALSLFSTQSAAAQDTASSTPSVKQIAAKIDEYMNAAVKFGQFTGSILVVRDGRPIISKGYGMANYELSVPNLPQTVFRIGSITKQFTAMAVMMLQEQGKLNVSDPICKYLENCPASWQPIVIRHLLTNTSGILNYTELPGSWDKDIESYPSAELVNSFRDTPLQFNPGERFAYSNSGFYLLGVIIEKASGKRYADFVRDNIFMPIGMKNSGYDDSRTLVPNRASGYNWRGKSFINAHYQNMATPYSAGGLYSTTEDLLLWDQALYTDKMVSLKSLDEMFSPFREVESAPDEWKGYAYAYGWGVGKMFEKQVTHHDGGISGFSSDITRFPSEGVTLIVLSNKGDATPKKTSGDLAAIVFGKPYSLVKQPVSDVLAPTIERRGIEPALRQYRELKRTQPAQYDFGEPVLNRLGYDLLRSEKEKEAIEIFKMNVEMFPQAFNVYDSLAEAYMAKGHKELAIKNYEKSLELNPENTNAVDMLKKLRGNN